MNLLHGIITNIEQAGGIMLIDLDVMGYRFSSILVESGDRDSWIKTGKPAGLAFKETEVSLAKNLSGKISMRNRMKLKVVAVEKGKLLSVIQLKFENYYIKSAITTRAAEYLELQINDEVDALIKANEIALVKL